MPLHSIIGRIITHMQAGGAIMIPLLGISLIVWTLALVKIIHFIRERHLEVSPEECIDIFNNQEGVNSRPMATWQRDILNQFLSQQCNDRELDRDLLTAMQMRQEKRALRHIGTIIVLAAVAPLLGLLGTVSGMITTFDVISQFGTGNARALASGISKALVTTQSGLVVAVPGIILGGFLYQRAQHLKIRMELFCIGIQEQMEISQTQESAV